MADDHDDEAMTRMRAADPALGSYPDQASLRRRLLEHTTPGHGAAGAAGEPFDGSVSDTAVRVHDGTTRGARRTMVAAAAAAALAIGAGGYAVGLQAADGGTRTDTAQGGEETMSQDSGETMGDEEAGGAVGGDTAGSGSYPFGPTVLEAGPDLPTEGATGEVRVLRPADIDPTEFLTSWADTLGLEGEVTEMEEGRYTELVSGAVYLSVSSGVSTDFSYSNMLTDPYCAEMLGTEGPEEHTDGSEGFRAQDCLPTGEVPGEDEAIAQAQSFLATSGISLEEVEWSAQTYEGDPQINVSGIREGRPSNSFDVAVTGAGVTSAHGSLGEYESLGGYPILSPTEAVERTSDPRFAWSGVWIPRLDEEAGTLDDIEPAQEPEPWDVVAGAPIPFPVNEATVVDATLDTGVLSLSDGTELWVPAYDLVDENGMHHAVLALADDALDLTP